ncbi:MAG: hypothetical protein NC342_08695 [Pseudoflavonifractor sp.]|nr:hypothetical protein [Alloprevotella sp.]MCM1117599.1 hypothetical protein [Pseudoflavonifractor sp.]
MKVIYKYISMAAAIVAAAFPTIAQILPAEGTASKVKSMVIVKTDGSAIQINLASGIQELQGSGDGSFNASSQSGSYSVTIPLADFDRVYLSAEEATDGGFSGSHDFENITIGRDMAVAIGDTKCPHYLQPDVSLLEKLRVFWSFANVNDPSNDCIALSPYGDVTGLSVGVSSINARWAAYNNRVNVHVLEQLIKGDANISGSISIDDVTKTVSFILGENPAGFDYNLADVNGDGQVVVGDVVAIVNLVLGIKEDDEEASPAVRVMAASSSAEPARYMVDSDGSIWVDSPKAIAGIEFDLAGGEWESSAALRRLSRSQSATEGGVHAIAYGSGTSYLPAGRHLIGSVTPGAKLDGDLYLSDRWGNTIPVTDVTLTGLGTVEADGDASRAFPVYDLSGRLVAPAGADESTLAPGVYIRGGKKFFIR